MTSLKTERKINVTSFIPKILIKLLMFQDEVNYTQ